MQLTIDNFDNAGTRDYSAAIDAKQNLRVTRKLNRVAELRVSLVSNGDNFVVPVRGARIKLSKNDGQPVFTGYVTENPIFEYLGWCECGPVYRYKIVAQSDEAFLDQKRLPDRSPFVARSAGDALRQMAEDVAPGMFDETGLQSVETIAWYAPGEQRHWSEHAAEVAVQARASYRAIDGALMLAPVGQQTWHVDEQDSNFNPGGLTLQMERGVVNDVTVVGRVEPSAHVKDYFVGDGYTMRFYLSQTPFTRRNRVVLDEEYSGAALDSTKWTLIDPSSAVHVTGGSLQVAGGTGNDGATTVRFAELIELGGAVILQHGDVLFSGASDGVLGGLYTSDISIAHCLTGFRVRPNGTQSTLQAVINGVATGAVISTKGGHQYSLTTRVYGSEIFRKQQTFHSSVHPGGAGLGGGDISGSVRVVLEVHDIDPSNPGSIVAAATVLFDGVISGAAGFCAYALVNAANLHCTIAFTRLMQAIDAEVRSALPGQSYRTRLVGSLSDGAECVMTQDPALQFFSQYAPAANELISVHYRGSSRAVGRVTNPLSVASEKRGSDDGVRGMVVRARTPVARTSADCENAAVALLEDSGVVRWSGKYETWSDFLPGGAQDIFPGDAIEISSLSRGVTVNAIVSEVDLEIRDLGGEHSWYRLGFVDTRSETLAFQFDQAPITQTLVVTPVVMGAVGTMFLPDLTSAEVTQVTSTSCDVDCGVAPPPNGGIEVRATDYGWGASSDRNLIGRFGTRSFTVPRLSRVQDYYLRQFDGSGRYSRCSTALHVDLPL